MNHRKKQEGLRWRVAQFILYVVSAGNDAYWVYDVPLSDAGGSCIDLDSSVLPKSELSDAGTYTREEVIKIASLAGHSIEQIDAALLLADTGDTSDKHDIASISDEDYERLIGAAKRRLIYFRRPKESTKSTHGNTPAT